MEEKTLRIGLFEHAFDDALDVFLGLKKLGTFLKDRQKSDFMVLIRICSKFKSVFGWDLY